MKIELYYDEAGRWPLAWPVYCSLLYCDNTEIISEAKDSKKLSEKKRDKIFNDLQSLQSDWRIFYWVWSGSAEVIDKEWIIKAIQKWIIEAFQEVMQKLLGLRKKPTLAQCKVLCKEHEIVITMDWNSDFGIGKFLWCRTIPVIDWDALITQISAASIVAKVSRDAYMYSIASKYPVYLFEKHKGYGTLKHRNAIIENGPCKLHRLSFLRNILNTTNT